jgi:hypothetical protein
MGVECERNRKGKSQAQRSTIGKAVERCKYVDRERSSISIVGYSKQVSGDSRRLCIITVMSMLAPICTVLTKSSDPQHAADLKKRELSHILVSRSRA